ncbi:hypothetical protein OnM2_024072 [Erysiphe neolycopersici]|uniref:RNase H type-1 domain-containing protein n=1 Tax=Erysiphe neolycopersici TaxID=212602 RepID=A0A420I1M9_9PEZI|nr:hypothetical protein OnM2_024072 [Erysiphe neolycopersici]
MVLQDINAVHTLLDSQAATLRIQNLRPRTGQWLAYRIRDKVEELQSHQLEVYVHWVLGHMKIEGNEQVDKATKKAATCSRKYSEEFIALSHVRCPVIERRCIECRQWLSKELCRRNPVSQSKCKLDLRTKSVNAIAFRTKKTIAISLSSVKILTCLHRGIS